MPAGRLRAALPLVMAILLGAGAVSVGLRLAQAWRSPASALVVLGGGIRREAFAAQLAQQLPRIPVIVSSGSPPPCLYRVFVEEHRIPWSRVVADFRATDTLTNFTATLPYLQAGGHRKVLLITSEGHAARASILAAIVWGSRGISFSTLTVGGKGHEESPGKTVADAARATAWVLLGEVSVNSRYNLPETVRRLQDTVEARCELGTARLPGARGAGPSARDGAEAPPPASGRRPEGTD